ncbi:MotA/TolQ/ExbB proton channel family protein [Amphibiibacter pelophylacis]|uniref:MotA/TolQ/ExbB proton channel family protein n=1 Tax=Amphibiibacter pelophylacis TaxID=1799477 RepID=A0ACC6P0U4_9BURK
MNPDTSAVPGSLAHFLGQTDLVGQLLFATLVLMSMLSWIWIVLKGVHMRRLRSRSRHFLQAFWKAPSLDQARSHIESPDTRRDNPFAELAAQALQARDHHTALAPDSVLPEAGELAESGGSGGSLFASGSLQDFVTRSLRRVLDEESTRLERGLTTLATIASTAPFVGLFGTVWGIYHALVAIGMSGSASLDQIAGPVGEALIMTAVGLFVAIPAVVAYNGYTRSNRVLAARLDAFAFDLLTLVSTGKTLAASPHSPR